jgi:hypothetical protein
MNSDVPDNNDEPFLSRWSRQKRGEKPRNDKAVTNSSLPARTPVAEESPAFDPASLPDIDDLTAESDISVFLRKGVPDALQKLALRRMWSLDPEICNFVEMAENQWDFNAPGGIHGLFEELAEGSDVSVWLAQATQSVVRKDPQEQVASSQTEAPSHNDPAPADPQQVALADSVSHANGATTGDRHNQSSVGNADPSDITPAAPVNQSEPSTTRRRHGGALPA